MRREIRGLLIVLVILMATASVVIGVVDSKNGAQGGMTISLRGTAPPANTPLFMIERSPDARYLRSALGITYDGKEWQLDKIAGQLQNVNRSSDDVKRLPLCTSSLSQSYRDFNRDVLNETATLVDPRCLQLPDSISDRVKDLSRRITENMPTPFEKARAIEEFLRVRYKYRLDYQEAPPNWEPNDWFLFESKEGICSNFNSAFVILARASGIPARLAAGYYIKPDDGEQQQVVYANQAHAWAEVGFQGLGWLAFEAVPQ
ncbi:MAG: transglutaminase-like domain-containing protein [Dehalococcoidia bacterium]|nr:transglutaminase-like domain-containing protein [Dehalococcoidia bacterium]